MVVDNHHAYGIIKDRVDSFWEQVRLIQPDDDQLMVLGGLIAIAAYAQLAAENLSLVPEQHGRDESIDEANQIIANKTNLLQELVGRIDAEKQTLPSLQKGVPRYSFEFDKEFLESWQGIAQDF